MHPQRTVLVVDDEPDMLQLLRRSLAPDLHCRVETALSGARALEVLAAVPVDLILADIRMPDMDGLELLELVKRQDPDQTVVMMTAYGSIEAAVSAMKQGACDFITKPFDHETLVVRLEKALERSLLLKENRRLQQECRQMDGFEGLVGGSGAMKQVFETVRTVAQTDLTVLITGESGTGKDLTARAVHALSPRAKGPFVAVNCPTVPEHILESELFGYHKGAFTHAVQNKPGLFQEAQGGSIFLDEIGDVSPAIQTKLLRVLQEKEIKPLGSTKTITVDVRIIASTNQNLGAKIKRGEFREDFFYRLNVLAIRLPALREHPEDIALIADHLLAKHCRKLNKPLRCLAPEVLALFRSRPWPGNVREMENLICQGILFAQNDAIGLADLGLASEAAPCNQPDQDGLPQDYKAAKQQTLRRFNEAFLGGLLKTHRGNVTQAAKACGLERQALQQVLRRYGIGAETFRNEP